MIHGARPFEGGKGFTNRALLIKPAAFDGRHDSHLNSSGHFDRRWSAIERGWLDKERAIVKPLRLQTGGRRWIITYFARDVARKLVGK